MTTKKIKLNTWGRNYVAVSAGQGEVDSRFLQITLVDETGDMTLTDKEVTLYAVKPDGNVIYNSCTIEDASRMILSVELTSQMSSTAGVVKCELHVMGTSQEVLKIVGLEIVILECSDTSSPIESTSEFTRLIEALSEVETLIDEYEALLGGPKINVIQTTGTSTTDVMSQKATTDSILNPNLSSGNRVRINSTTPIYSGATDITLIDSRGTTSVADSSILIGCSSYSSTGSGLISIGLNSRAGSGCIAIGNNSYSNEGQSVTVGANSYSMSNGVSVGDSITTYSGNCVNVGTYSGGTTNSVSLGYDSKATTSAYYSVSLGANSRATEASVVSVGDGTTNANYGKRRIVNVKDPTNAGDAATKNYVDTRVPAAIPTLPLSGTYTLKSIDGILTWVSG